MPEWAGVEDKNQHTTKWCLQHNQQQEMNNDKVSHVLI